VLGLLLLQFRVRDGTRKNASRERARQRMRQRAPLALFFPKKKIKVFRLPAYVTTPENTFFRINRPPAPGTLRTPPECPAVALTWCSLALDSRAQSMKSKNRKSMSEASLYIQPLHEPLRATSASRDPSTRPGLGARGALLSLALPRPSFTWDGKITIRGMHKQLSLTRLQLHQLENFSPVYRTTEETRPPTHLQCSLAHLTRSGGAGRSSGH
jgi:hypothetical protein